MKIDFDASKVEPAKPFEAVPTGWYKCAMTASEGKPASTGAGNGYAECEYTIIEGEYQGRKLFDRFNLWNTNPVAVEIAYKQLSAVCHAVGVIQISDTALLHNRPLMVRAMLKPAGSGANGIHYDASNEVKGYKSVDAAGPVATPVAPPMPAASAPWTPPAVAAPVQPVVAAPVAPVQPAWAPPAPAQPAAPVAPWAAPAQPAAAAPVAPPAPVAPAAPKAPWEK